MSWKLKKKCLDILAREDGYVRKIWGDALTIALAYPNVYRTGMSNLGFQAVYALINRHPACLCERVFLPDPGDAAAHRASPSPLFSLESQRPLADFDMVAFSLSFENDYPNILKILDMAGIPLETRRRHRRHAESRTPRRILRPLSDRRRRGPSPRFSRRRGRLPPATHAGGVPQPDTAVDCRGVRPPVLPGFHRPGGTDRRP
jgi:hypothetical protein